MPVTSRSIVSSPTAKSPSATLTGVVERIIFLNEENQYTIAELRPDAPANVAAKDPGDSKARPEAVTIVGPLPGVECGETLHLTGEWTRHAQHGSQFKIISFKSELPGSVYGIRKYLGSGLVPGRKCRTSPRGTAVSVASSHGYGCISSDGSYSHIMLLRMYGSVM